MQPPAQVRDRISLKLECDGPGWPRVLLSEFAPALGERGIAEVERLVAERALTADRQSWTGAFAVRDLREQLAEVSGDVDRYVTVLAEHLASAVQYQRIAEALRAAGRRDDAVDWARRGVAANEGSPYMDRLRDVLVDMLVAAGDTQGAVRVRREEFARHPTAMAYRSLVDTVAVVGGDDPKGWAVGVLRERVAQQPACALELVDVLLAVGRDDEAWHEALHHRRSIGGAPWQTLLERRAVTHPAEVIQPYRDLRRAGDPQLGRQAALPAGRRPTTGAGGGVPGDRRTRSVPAVPGGTGHRAQTPTDVSQDTRRRWAVAPGLPISSTERNATPLRRSRTRR
ncbi:DUF6880 family protein [Micromonospora purpureochromogenes]|uniref:DUF6880 family protein n=1 Tax=Micromonospora purpureochromogenes TaxID=47872 RepID=UPI00362DFE26